MVSGFITTWEPLALRTLLLRSLLLLGAAGLLLGGVSASNSHSLLYLFIGVSEPTEGLPKFILVEYLDDQLFLHYDSVTRRDVPRTSWIRKAEQNDPQVWDWRTELSRNWEQYMEDNLWLHFNHSKGTHTWQWLGGCDLSADGHVDGYSQLAYDGNNFLSLDMERLTWIAAHPRAEVTKRKWEADREWTQDQKNFLEGTCIEWMKEFLGYGKESLLRKDAPQVKVTLRADYEGLESLVCRVDGFYPRDIHVAWMKDEELWEQETLQGVVAPNSDGTYHTWISTKISRKDRGRFRCRVDHASWEDPVDFVMEEPASTSNLGLIIGCSVGLIVLIVVGLFMYLRRWQRGYEATSTNDQEASAAP